MKRTSAQKIVVATGLVTLCLGWFSGPASFRYTAHAETAVPVQTETTQPVALPGTNGETNSTDIRLSRLVTAEGQLPRRQVQPEMVSPLTRQPSASPSPLSPSPLSPSPLAPPTSRTAAPPALKQPTALPEPGSLTNTPGQTGLPAPTLSPLSPVLPNRAVVPGSSASSSSRPVSRGITGTGRPGPAGFEGPQEACVVLQKNVPAEIQVNREDTFTLVVKNTGKSTAKDVVLKEQIPAKAALISTDPKTAVGTDGQIVWQNFDLEPNMQREFKYVLVPLEEGEIGSVANVSFNASASAKTRCTKPQLHLEVKAPQEVMIGDEFILDIAITNPGTGTATGVVLLEKVPEGLSHPGGSILDNQLKTLAPNETKRLTLTLKGVKPGKVVNELSVKADNGLVEERQTPIQVTSPELQLEIVGAKTRYLDREATYVCKIQNPGTAPAKDVKLVVDLPQNVEFVRTNNLGEYNKTKHSVHWELVELPQNLPPGELELVVKPVKLGEGQLTFHAVGRNELAAETTQPLLVDGLPALAYEVKSLTDPVEVGKEAVYEVRISNRGTKSSTNINMSVAIPGEMKVVSSDGPTQFSQTTNGIAFGRIAAIEPKQEAVFRIHAVCTKPGDHRIKVQVSSDDMELLVKEESTRVYY